MEIFTPISVRLYETATRLGSRIISLPQDFATRLILKRLARPVGNLLLEPDVVITEDDIGERSDD